MHCHETIVWAAEGQFFNVVWYGGKSRGNAEANSEAALKDLRHMNSPTIGLLQKQQKLHIEPDK